MKKFIACIHAMIIGLLVSSLSIGAGTEVRKWGSNDFEWATPNQGAATTTTSSSGKVVTKIDAAQVPLRNANGYVDNLIDGSYSLTPKVADLITRSPWVDVRAYIPVALHAVIAAGTDNTNLSSYLQAASDNSVGKILYWPKGIYHGKVNVTTAQHWVGDNWDGTILSNNIDTDPAITVTNASFTGASFSHMRISGGLGNGMWIQAQGSTELYFMNILSNVGHGLRIGGTAHTASVTIRHSRFQSNTLSGIYGKPSLGTTVQINDIKIIDSEISQNGQHGVDLLGTKVDVVFSTIQGNDNTGIFIGGDATCAYGASTANYNILYNYFESNTLGNIKGISDYDVGTSPTTVHYGFEVNIEGNYLYSSDNTVALIDFSTVGAGEDGYPGSRIGRNYYSSASDTAPYVDLHSSWGIKNRILHNYIYGSGAGFATRFKNLGNTQVEPDGWLEGAGVPSATPNYRNQRYSDTTNKIFYIAKDAGSATSWHRISNYTNAGAGAPSGNPLYIGQDYINTTDNTVYKAVCILDNTCWKALN